VGRRLAAEAPPYSDGATVLSKVVVKLALRHCALSPSVEIHILIGRSRVAGCPEVSPFRLFWQYISSRSPFCTGLVSPRYFKINTASITSNTRLRDLESSQIALDVHSFRSATLVAMSLYCLAGDTSILTLPRRDAW
jgi:hypothetical protein